MLSLETFTLVHVLISLLGIASGFVVLSGLLGDNRLEGWTTIFLVSTAATSITGFGFPFTQVLPSHVIGVLSLVVLAVAILARYTYRMNGTWRWLYIVSAVIALYFNVFVLVVQLFRRVPALHAMAPTESESPFLIAQLVVLVIFVMLGARATNRFHPTPFRAR